MWTKGMQKTYFILQYREDFGSWQYYDHEFESYDAAADYAWGKYYHYRIFRIEKYCMETNPGYG